MKRKLTSISLLLSGPLVALASAPALAHPGHGVADPGSFWHAIIDHAPVIGVTAAAVIVVGGVLGGRRRSS